MRIWQRSSRGPSSGLSPFTWYASAHAESKPSVLRVANPGVGAGNRPTVGGSSWSLVHLRGLLEQEFKNDGIKVEGTFLRGAGPAVNEVFANGLADVASYGDLPSTIGRAGGLRGACWPARRASISTSRCRPIRTSRRSRT